MMAALRSWLTAVLAAAVLLSLAERLAPEGSLRKITSLVGGLILLLVCFMPTWIICVLGVLLILAGIALIVLRTMRRH